APSCAIPTATRSRRSASWPGERSSAPDRSRPPPRLGAGPCAEGDFAFVLPVPVMDAPGRHFQHPQARRIGALLEPAIEPGRPVFLEAGLVAYNARLALDMDEQARLADDAEHPGLALIGQPDRGIALDVVDHAGVLAGEEAAGALVLHLAVVAHRPAADRAVLRPGHQHAVIDV